MIHIKYLNYNKDQKLPAFAQCFNKKKKHKFIIKKKLDKRTRKI